MFRPSFWRIKQTNCLNGLRAAKADSVKILKKIKKISEKLLQKLNYLVWYKYSLRGYSSQKQIDAVDQRAACRFVSI